MTDNELSAKVAEFRGDRRESMCTPLKEGVYYYTRPDGIEIPLFPNINQWQPKPYATDMNCAMELCEEIKADKGVGFVRINADLENEWSFEIFDSNDSILFSIEASTAARAICKAYLQFKEQQND